MVFPSEVFAGKIGVRTVCLKNSAKNTGHSPTSGGIMAGNKPGRKKGGRNRSFIYRKARGGYAVEGRRRDSFRYEDGTHIKTENVEEKELRDAWPAGDSRSRDRKPRTTRRTYERRYDLGRLREVRGPRKGPRNGQNPRRSSGHAFEFCSDSRQSSGTRLERIHSVIAEPANPSRYARHRRRNSQRQDSVGPRCPRGVQDKKHRNTERLDAHSTGTDSGRRTRIQAVKRAFNLAVEEQYIDVNPIRGYRKRSRVGEERGSAHVFGERLVLTANCQSRKIRPIPDRPVNA